MMEAVSKPANVIMSGNRTFIDVYGWVMYNLFQDPCHRVILMLSLLHMNSFLLFQIQWSKADSHNSLLQQGKGWRMMEERNAREEDKILE